MAQMFINSPIHRYLIYFGLKLLLKMSMTDWYFCLNKMKFMMIKLFEFSGNLKYFSRLIKNIIRRTKKMTQAILNNIFSLLFGVPTKSSVLVFLLVFCFSMPLLSQEKIGLATNNYGGVYSNQMNPAVSLGSKVFFDFNFVGTDVFFENNFLFIHKEDYNLIDYLSRAPTWPVSGVRGSGLDYSISDELVQGYQQIDVMGPSVSFSLTKHTIGLFSKMMQVASINDLPRDIAMLMYEGLEYDTFYGTEFSHGAFDMSTMGWWEIGGNYVYVFREKQRYVFSAGINLQVMFGYTGINTNVERIDCTLHNDDSLSIRNFNAGIGFSVPIDFETNDYPAAGAKFKGKGFGIDLGAVYVRKKELRTTLNSKRYCSFEPGDYLYKIGLSVLDLGKITYKENARQHRYENVGVDLGDLDTLAFGNVNDFTAQLSAFFYGDPTVSLQSSSFALGLPTRMSVQADYQYYPNWYLNVSMVMRVRILKTQLRKPSLAIASLRYETERFEVNMQLSLYDFRKPRLGLYARYYFLLASALITWTVCLLLKTLPGLIFILH